MPVSRRAPGRADPVRLRPYNRLNEAHDTRGSPRPQREFRSALPADTLTLC